MAAEEASLRRATEARRAELEQGEHRVAELVDLRKGQMGSALMGSLQTLCCFLTEGLFGYFR